MRYTRLARREFLAILCGATAPLLAPPWAFAHNRVHKRIGYLTPIPLFFDDDFRRGLRDLGYVEGTSVSLLAPFGPGKDDNLRAMAKELADAQSM